MRELMEQQIQEQVQQLQMQQIQAERINAQIKLIVHQILSPEARSRLGNIRVARPEFARQIEILLIQLYQAGRLPKKLTDSQFKKILEELQSKKREIKIERV